MRAILGNKRLQIAVLLFLEVISIAMGMGVPIFTIMYGFFVGIFIPRILDDPSEFSPTYLRTLMKFALITGTVTFTCMAILWLPSLSWLFDRSRDLSTFGIPMILYSPRASFIGWIILMVFISPFLQFLMALFGSVVWIALLTDRRRSGEGSTGGLIAA